MASPDWLVRPFAHRGLHDHTKGIVENTGSAFQAAIDAGYAIETDVRASGDGEIMVFHDATLERLTEGSGAVAELGATALKKTRFRGTSDKMFTLGDLLELISGRVPLLIEIKSGWSGQGPLEQRIAEYLASCQGHAAVMSFDPRSVAAFAAAAPGTPRGLVAGRFDAPLHWAGLTTWQRFKLRHLLSAFIARPQFIAYDIRALPALAPVATRTLFGWPLLTWTVRSKAERRTARKWADAMIFEGFRP
jgi:glycerophosphoryl diester phosphodiesterase